MDDNLPKDHESVEPHTDDTALHLNRSALLQKLEQLQSADSLEALQRAVADLWAAAYLPDAALRCETEEDRITFDRAYLSYAFDQIGTSRTLRRAQHYVARLIKGITEIRTSPINDINLNRWKEYDHIITDSLWKIERRDNSGVHSADYWGNFVPQIPRQMMLRYSKAGDWVLDPFAGCGTTLIEAQRLGRHAIGVELQADIADRARRLLLSEPNPHGVTHEIVTGDSCALDYGAILRKHNRPSVQLVVLHPPYFDIIKFSDDPRDLSNATCVAGFLVKMGAVIDRAREVLDPGRFLVLVIGDKYSKGEWIPLGFQTMSEVTQRGFLLKSIVVKNFEETTGKRSQKELWRYRALVGGFYIFKHEYIFIFKKQ